LERSPLSADQKRDDKGVGPPHRGLGGKNNPKNADGGADSLGGLLGRGRRGSVRTGGGRGVGGSVTGEGRR